MEEVDVKITENHRKIQIKSTVRGVDVEILEGLQFAVRGGYSVKKLLIFCDVIRIYVAR